MNRRTLIGLAHLATFYVVLLAGCRADTPAGDNLEAVDNPAPDPASPEIPNVEERLKIPLRGDEPQKGPDDGLVTIVELGDFERPHCSSAKPTLDHMAQRYGDDSARGTPAFFINGKLSIQGRPPFETFKAAIDAEL